MGHESHPLSNWLGPNHFAVAAQQKYTKNLWKVQKLRIDFLQCSVATQCYERA